MCACRLSAARPPFVHSVVPFPTSCFVPAVENDENANMGSTGARNRSGARGSGKGQEGRCVVERRGTSTTSGEDRPTAAQDDRRAWRQTLEWAAEVRLYNRTGRGDMSWQCCIRRNGTWPTPSTTPSWRAECAAPPIPQPLKPVRRRARSRVRNTSCCRTHGDGHRQQPHQRMAAVHAAP